MRDDTEKTAIRVVTVGYALLLYSILMSAAWDSPPPAYSLIVKALMTIAISAILSAAGGSAGNKSRFF
jgi:hypothetical protein